MIATLELIDLTPESVHGVAAVVLEEGNGGNSEQLGGVIASGTRSGVATARRELDAC